jgi:hypothetical protein
MLLAAVTLPSDADEDGNREGKAAGAAHFLSPEKAPLLQARTLCACQPSPGRPGLNLLGCSGA